MTAEPTVETVGEDPRVSLIADVVDALWDDLAAAVIEALDRHDEGQGVVRVNLVKQRAGESIIAAILAFVVVLVGACLCGVGLLVAVPLSVLMLGWSWRTLLGEPVA